MDPPAMRIRLRSIYSPNVSGIKRRARLMRGLRNALVGINKEANLLPQTK